MQTAIIVAACLVGLFIIWYVNLLDYFYPKDLSPREDPDLMEWEKEKAARWTKH
jgi:hypothetical protein